MTIEDLTNQIQATRDRLREIELERGRLGPEDLGMKVRLLDESHALQAQLAWLEDEASRYQLGRAEERAAAQIDLTRAPELPRS